MERHHIVIIGAGISGLTTAFWLKQLGAAVTILEKDPVPGGTMRTVRHEGWLVETGPNSALETTPVFNEMFTLLGLTQERLYADPASDKRYILRNGTLHALPMSPRAFLATRLWSPLGKLRLLKEPFIGRGDREETVAEFVQRRLGWEFLEYAINPFVAGVYAGNPEQLSVRTAFPKLYALEEKYGGLITGMIRGARERKRRAEVAKDRAKMFSFRSGMEAFPDALGRYLGLSVQCCCTVTSVEQVPAGSGGGPGFRVHYTLGGKSASLDADAVVFAVPAHAAAPLLEPFNGELADMLREVYYPPVAEVFLGYAAAQCARPLDGFGFLVPAAEQRKILGTIWSSALFPDRAPEEHIALTTFVGGSRQPELVQLGDDELIDLVRGELADLMGVHGTPAFTSVVRWEQAIPQYNLGYHAVLEEIDNLEQNIPGLMICSNYRGGIAVGDCVKNGKATATRIAQVFADRGEQ